MNFLSARQIEGSNKWRYTCFNDKLHSTYAIGYCYRNNCLHETAEEAKQCYKEYLLNNSLVFGVRADVSAQAKLAPTCAICNEPTLHFAEVLPIYGVWSLCLKHNNKETVSKLLTLRVINESQGSYDV